MVSLGGSPGLELGALGGAVGAWVRELKGLLLEGQLGNVVGLSLGGVLGGTLGNSVGVDVGGLVALLLGEWLGDGVGLPLGEALGLVSGRDATFLESNLSLPYSSKLAVKPKSMKRTLAIDGYKLTRLP